MTCLLAMGYEFKTALFNHGATLDPRPLDPENPSALDLEVTAKSYE